MSSKEPKQHQVTFNEEDNAEIEYEEQEIEDDPEVYRQFITLVDGVVSSLALLQTDMDNFLYFKDELMQQLLPPNLLLQLSLISGKMFRSYSDLQFPLWELLRLVRVYSSPWEEKKAALQKMHEDYARKKSQLEIALRRLTTQDAEVKRAARERRIMNWEKLFARVQMARGHGRRWKFRMHDFKKLAAMGVEHLGKYFAEDQSDLESDAEPSEVGEDADAGADDVDEEAAEARESLSTEETLQRVATEEKTAAAVQQVDEEFPEIELESMSEIEPDEPLIREQTDVHSVSMPAEIALPVETADAEVWTHEPEFARRLHVRVYPARQVKAKQVTVDVEFGVGDGEGLVSQRLEVQDVLAPAADEKRRMPRKRQGATSDENGSSSDGTGAAAYQEVSFSVPDGVAPEHGGPALRLTVQNERMDQVGAAVLSLHQLVEADLLTLDTGDDVGAVDNEEELERRRRTLDELGPTEFPLLLNDIEAGQLPMLIYWTRWPVLRAVDRDNNTASIFELVEDLTGIDLTKISKEELTREKIDACMSPRPMTPQPENVPKEEFDKLNEEFSEKFSQLEQDYISKLKTLEAQLAGESSAEPSVQRQPTADTQERATSAQRSLPGSRRSSGRRATPQLAQQAGEDSAPQPQPQLQSQPPPPKKAGIRVAPRPQRPQKNFMIGRPLPAWGEGFPDDFFERMELLSHLTREHKARLVAQIRAEIAREVEAQLMELSRLAASYNDDEEAGEEDGDERRQQRPQAGQLSASDEVTIPALFMPQRGEPKVYNPRAHMYFQPHGIRGARLTQPPSMLSLPPLPNRTSILNLFDLSNRSGQAGQSVSVSAPPPNASIQTQLSLLKKAAN